MSVMVFALSISLRWSILTFLNLKPDIVHNGKSNSQRNVRVYSEQKFSLMRTYSPRIYSFH